MDELRYCGVPDHVGSAASKWPDGKIPWTITDSVPGISDADLQYIIGEALGKWAAVCGITPVFVESAAQARILVTHRAIDGPFNVLAETELPMGQPQCHLWFDSEGWTESQPPEQRRVSIRIVGLHELGHALGLGHVTTQTAVMNPVYNPSVNSPKTWDIQQLQARYGPPVAEPTPAPSPVPNPGGSMQNWLVQMAIAALKSWIQAKIADGSLITLLTDLLNKLSTGQITTADQFEAHVEQLVASP